MIYRRSDFSPATLAAFDHYGIDPEAYGFGGTGGAWCDVCINHPESSPRPICDLEKARRAEMEALGFDCRTCPHCRKVYPAVIGRAALCPGCKRAQDDRDRTVAAQIRRRRHRRRPRTNTVRIPDGAGCTERVPLWMLDPNEGRS